MLVMTHELFLKSQPSDLRIEVRLYQPVQFDKDWGCRYEIDWPEGPRAMTAHGLDGHQHLNSGRRRCGSSRPRSSGRSPLFMGYPGDVALARCSS